MMVPPSVKSELWAIALGHLPPQRYWLRSAQRKPPPGQGFPNAKPACRQTKNGEHTGVKVKNPFLNSSVFTVHSLITE